MAFNGSGVFNIDTAGQPVVDGTLIDATVFNALTADLATGLSTALTKDGQTTATANLPMGGFKITALGLGTANTDAARVDNVGAKGTCEFRLTLTTNTPVTTGDVVGASTIYLSPYKGNRIALYDGSNWVMRSSAQVSIALSGLTTTVPYDVFAYDNSGTLTLELAVWSTEVDRNTALTAQDGVLVKLGALTRRYLGTFFPASASTTEDTVNRRCLWNYYNRVRKSMRALEATNTWNYTTATIRAANGSTSNRLVFVVGVNEDMVSADIRALASNTGATTNAAVGVGLDSTSTFTTGGVFGRTLMGTATSFFALSASLKTYPGVGLHFLSWNEYSDAVGTTTWYGDNGDPTNVQSGIHGEIWA